MIVSMIGLDLHLNTFQHSNQFRVATESLECKAFDLPHQRSSCIRPNSTVLCGASGVPDRNCTHFEPASSGFKINLNDF